MGDAVQRSAVPAVTKPAEHQRKSRKSEIAIAVIGLISTIGTGVISNWQKLGRDSAVSDDDTVAYRPTSNFDTELRYFFEVSGTRASFDAVQRAFINAVKIELLEENPSVAANVVQFANELTRDPMRLDDILERMLPVFREHFTVSELQELNRFYSTERMQRMLQRMPPVIDVFAAKQVELAQQYRSRAFHLLQAMPKHQLDLSDLLEQFEGR
jgi:hypothetical protein